MKPSAYVLWLPSWYPNIIQPYNGDFIQRHAVAVAAHFRVEVIHILRDKEGIVTQSVKMVQRQRGNLRETIIYYYVKPGLSVFTDRLRSHLLYTFLFKKQFKHLLSEQGLPIIAHVHVALKAGVHALWLKRKYNLPYLVSEQWVGFLPDSNPSLKDVPLLLRRQARQIFCMATGISAVSTLLGKHIKARYSVAMPELIPNLVQADIFHLKQRRIGVILQLVHISTLDFQKNPEGMFVGLAALKRDYAIPFSLVVVGPSKPELHTLVKALNIADEVIFRSEMPQGELAELINTSDALVLWSRYETFGCVIIEANACGRPVVVSGLEVFKENVVDGKTGLVAKGNEPEDLAALLAVFYRDREKFDPEKIRAHALDNFGTHHIGKLFSNWYHKVFGERF